MYPYDSIDPHLGAPLDPRNQRVANTRLLPFPIDGALPSGDHWELSVPPQIPFRPVGLWLFGWTADTWLSAMAVGNEETLLAAPGEVPAEVFASPYSFEELAEQIEMSDEQVAELQQTQPDRAAFVQRLLDGFPRLRYEGGRKVSAFSQLSCPTTHLGNLIRLRGRGPLRAAVLLGKTLQ